MDNNIETLIPQRAPFRMVDYLMEAKEKSAITSLRLTRDNYLMENGLMTEAGLIEHIAQSASALAGYLSLKAGATKAPVGYIGEIRNFHCYRRPKENEELRTSVLLEEEVGNISLINGETRSGEETIATVQMKIFIEKEV